MSVTAEQERSCYDGVYGRFLELPPEALRFDRAILTRTLRDTAQPYFERRRRYERILRVLMAEPAAGRRVLDSGCGTGVAAREPWSDAAFRGRAGRVPGSGAGRNRTRAAAR